MLWSFLIDFNLSWIFRAVAQANHSLIKMIYCLGGLLFFGCLQTARILKLNSCPWGLPSLSCPPQESRRAHIQRLDGLKILGSPKHNSDFFFPPNQFSLTSLLCLSWCYRCHCPPQFDGPDCQQTRLSFLGNGYAWLPPIRPCFDSHLSLEFMTDGDDGLLLYAGPLATLLPGDTEDYMAIGNCAF